MSDVVGPYTIGDELPSITPTWKDSNGNVIDFSSGFTYRLRVALNGVTALEKTSGITGASTAPNITIDWTVDELAALTGGQVYTAQLRARRTSDNKDRTLAFAVKTSAELGAVP
jgi:hypothetical protein